MSQAMTLLAADGRLPFVVQLRVRPLCWPLFLPQAAEKGPTGTIQADRSDGLRLTLTFSVRQGSVAHA